MNKYSCGLLLASAALVFGAGCCKCGDKRDLPKVVPVDMAQLDLSTPCSRATPSGKASIWDFTAGTPEGGKILKYAARDENGLRALEPQKIDAPAGFRLNEKWTPQGAFLFEAEFVAGDLGNDAGRRYEGIIWDDMAITYVPKRTDRGFQLGFETRNKMWTPVLWLGFSNSTERVVGPTVMIEPGKLAKIAFYFNANGNVVWDFNGECRESGFKCKGGLAPAVQYRPTLGDRATSNHRPLNGVLRKISITPCKVDQISVRIDGRAAFVRGEKNAEIKIAIDNSVKGNVDDVRMRIEQFVEGGRILDTGRFVGAIANGGSKVVACPVETRIRTGWNPLRITLTGVLASGEKFSCVRVFRLGVGPRPDDRMTVLMWGYNAPESVLADYGFTHGLKYLHSGYPHDRQSTHRFDSALVEGIRLTHSMPVMYPDGKMDDKYMRKDSKGVFRTRGKDKPKKMPEVSNPEIFEKGTLGFIKEDIRVQGSHPGFVGVLPISEERDGTFPSFNTEHLRYKAETGRDVPAGISEKTFGKAGFAKFAKKYPDGNVPDNDPVLSYYRWFWRGGDGWPTYVGKIADEYRAGINRPDFFSFWDPAVRCPPIWGSGGSVDMINQWVYAVPEPMNVAGPAEEMLAMSAGRPGQKTSIMTQLICYRSQIAPMNKKVSPEPEWVKRRPLAEFPTIPPDTLQEATWSMIAKPVDAIMYHGWGTIYETGSATRYVFTNPESTERIKHLLKDIVAPLGPTLKRLGRRPPPVAILESFTTCALGGPASWGWKAPAITFLQRARLDPRVVFEDTILRDGLNDVKVLYAPQCKLLPSSVIAKINEFQSRGGILMADNQLAKALKADVEVSLVSFSPPPESDHTAEVNAMEAAREGDARTRRGTLRAKAKMLAQANEVRRLLAPKFTPEADSSSPEIVVYSRSWNSVRYLFAINDHRTFGDYVGPWGLTMEKGLPYEGDVSVVDDGTAKAVYELSKGGEVAFSRESGRIKVPVKYETNDGRLFVFLNSRIASVKVDAPRSVHSGRPVRVNFKVLGDDGKPVEALLPGEVRLYDSSGRELDGAGWVCLKGGVCTVDIQTNVDDPAGDYRLVCKDRASGLSVERIIKRH
ncbi:MAG: hypothetical protein J6R18_07540 [Kiritimatiellae bacterium]|nr:hypothetical protein [Kiritimatiellia bacterium]